VSANETKDPVKDDVAAHGGGAEVARLQARVAELEKALAEAEQKSTGDPAFEASLANLYCASYQLHATVDVRELVQVTLEILLNFVGAKTAAIFVLDANGGEVGGESMLVPIAVTGLDESYVPQQKLGEGRIGETCKRGHALYDENAAERGIDVDRPTVVVPLRLDGQVVGAIVVWSFLRQKPTILDYDRELFDLLAAHLAPALAAAVLFKKAGKRSLDYSDLKDWAEAK
jgi:GAF domain-containing protein